MGSVITVYYLVAVLISGGQAYTQVLGSQPDIANCFEAREQALLENSLYSTADRRKHGVQLLCVAKDEEFN